MPRRRRARRESGRDKSRRRGASAHGRMRRAQSKSLRGTGETKAEKSNPKSGPQAANPVKSLEKLKSKLRRCTNTGGGVSKVLRSQTGFPKAISHRYRYAHRMHTAAASTILYFWHAQRSTYKKGAKGSACLIGRKV